MISPADAWQRLLPHVSPMTAAALPREEALGRVLSAAVAATVDVPAADVSAMDGYAVAGDVAAGTRLEVTGTVQAGDPPGVVLTAGAALRIMTGAPLPEGADRVAPVEDTDGGESAVTVGRTPAAGAHVRRRGEVHRRGEEILAAGTRLGAGALGLLAAHGHAEAPVHRPPRVAVLATGDEVVPPAAQPARGQLRDSHTDFLLAAGRSLGLGFDSLGIAPDRPEALRRAIDQGLGHDVLLVCGGVSKGLFDLVEGVLEGAGCRTLFDAVAVQPGKPLVAAVGPQREPARRPCLVFGLPGNPASVMVCFWLFVRPALRRLAGLADGFWEGALPARLAAPLPGAKGRDRFLPARVRLGPEGVLAEPLPPRGSHDLAAYARGSALVRVPARSAPLSAGSRCEILPLVDWLEG
ncbi:MAG TPA: gephyrin-like molybdotransferase Glp [Thermoanaerobaculia bacterium]|nr:gephyrin-like molybdotransferase Glp [Thermoanaerobaculia bacterium]